MVGFKMLQYKYIYNIQIDINRYMTNRHKDIYIEYKKYIIYIINMQVIIIHTFVSSSNCYISYMHYYTQHPTILLKVVRNKHVWIFPNMAKNWFYVILRNNSMS